MLKALARVKVNLKREELKKFMVICYSDSRKHLKCRAILKQVVAIEYSGSAPIREMKNNIEVSCYSDSRDYKRECSHCAQSLWQLHSICMGPGVRERDRERETEREREREIKRPQGWSHWSVCLFFILSVTGTDATIVRKQRIPTKTDRKEGGGGLTI